MFVTAKHYNPGLKRDAASIWIEDVTRTSCKVCLRELQNYAGSHKDIHVVSTVKSSSVSGFKTFKTDIHEVSDVKCHSCDELILLASYNAFWNLCSWQCLFVENRGQLFSCTFTTSSITDVLFFTHYPSLVLIAAYQH